MFIRALLSLLSSSSGDVINNIKNIFGTECFKSSDTQKKTLLNYIHYLILVLIEILSDLLKNYRRYTFILN